MVAYSNTMSSSPRVLRTRYRLPRGNMVPGNVERESCLRYTTVPLTKRSPEVAQ